MGSATPNLSGRRILVVEDDYLVSLILVDLLEDAGAVVLGPIGSLEEAITFIEEEREPFDAAVLDVNLRGQKSYPIADALISRSVGFVFATGYGSDALDDRYQSHPRCEKPFDQATIISALAAI